MPSSPSVLVMIPARLAATRLQGKPLLDIAGSPMIVQVMRRALEANVGPVVVACDDETIAGVVIAAGGNAVMTRRDHPSGSDRIHEAVTSLDPDRTYDVILNVQGDLPTIDPRSIRACFAPLDEREVDIATIAAEITREEEKIESSVVKVVGTPIAADRLRALYFTRATAPTGPGPLYHHIGLYAYRRAALERFVSLPPAPLEMREKLEQLRALEAGMRIDVGIVATVPLGVDTPADLDRARKILADTARGGRNSIVRS